MDAFEKMTQAEFSINLETGTVGIFFPMQTFASALKEIYIPTSMIRKIMEELWERLLQESDEARMTMH